MSGRPGNPFLAAIGTAKLKKVVPKENIPPVADNHAVIEERPLVIESANLHSNEPMTSERQEKISRLKLEQERIAKELANETRLDEDVKKRCFNTLAGFNDKGKKTPGKYKIVIAGSNNLAPQENELQVCYDHGELFYKDGNNPQISMKIEPMKIELADPTLSNKFTSLETLTIDNKRAILQLLYDNAFINGEQLKEMALRAEQTKATVKIQSASQIATISKDSPTENIVGYWNAGIFSQKRVADTMAHRTSLSSLDQMPKLKQFIEDLATLENEDKLPKLISATSNLKQLMLSNRDVVEEYAAVRRDIEEVRSSSSGLLNQTKINEIKAEVIEGVRKYGIFSDASKSINTVPEGLSSFEKRKYEDAIPNKMNSLINDNHWKNKKAELPDAAYQALISTTFGNVSQEFKENLGKYGSYELASAALQFKDKFTSNDLSNILEALQQDQNSTISNRMKNASLALSKIKQFEEFDSLYSSMTPQKISEVKDKLVDAERKRSPSIARRAVDVHHNSASEKSGIENISPQQSSLQSALASALAAGKKVKSELSDEVPPKRSSLQSALAEALLAAKQAKEQGIVVGGPKTESPKPAKKKVQDLGGMEL